MSEFAEIVATCAMSCFPFTVLLAALRLSKIFSQALSIPRFTSTGFAPAVIFLSPSLKIAFASTVAVVVPSPASSAVFDATSLTSCAPMSSSLSFNSISRATDTPSFVSTGAP